MAQRVSWDEYFLQIATLAATRSTCLRRNVGCVLVRDRHVLATGYNGVPAKAPHCADKGCLRQERNIPSGQRMDICRAVHAEANAIAQCAKLGVCVQGATAYVTVTPCSKCAALLVQAGVIAVVSSGVYPDEDTKAILEEANVTVKIIPMAGA
jgi:dCMP deaminase